MFGERKWKNILEENRQEKGEITTTNLCQLHEKKSAFYYTIANKAYF